MAAAAKGLEKLEDMIVRQAEATGAQVAAAKAAIGECWPGPRRRAADHHPVRWPCPARRAARACQTKLVETMGVVLGLEARRIQFTPDLMPSDIVGSEMLEESPGGKRSFRFIPGPISDSF